MTQHAERPLRVFVASTSDDLAPYRARVDAAIRQLRQQSVAMETFVARPGAPLAECRQLVAGADALVAIVAHCYGSVPAKEQGGDGAKCFTWLEIEAAGSATPPVPVFAFVVDPKAPWSGPKDTDRLGHLNLSEAEKQAAQAAIAGLRRFKTWLSATFTCRPFSTPDSLVAEVMSTFNVFMDERRAEAAASRAPSGAGAPEAATSAEADDRVTLAAYLRDVIAETGRLDIRGIASASGATRAAISRPIEELYTPLSTVAPTRGNDGRSGSPEGPRRRRERHPPAGAECPVSGLERDDPSHRVALTALLGRCRELLIIGAPGSGKTTFLKLIACVLAKDSLIGVTDGALEAPGRGRLLGLPLDREPPLPIFVRLAELARFMGAQATIADPAGVAWLERFLAERHGAALAALVGTRLAAGRAALLLDGLDEVVDPAVRRRVLAFVDKLRARFGENLRVTTSRPFGHEDVASLAGVTTVTVDEFADGEIREFLDRWVLAIAPAADVPVGPDYRALLEAAIVDVPAVRRMARNPVMLTCLCVVHWNERLLPEGKADLLSAVLRWLLNAHDETRRERGYGSAFAEECFKALALAMTAHPRGKRTVEDLNWAAEQLAAPFRRLRQVDDAETLRAEGRRFLEHEMLDSGIVEQARLGQLRFWHLTFQEHYAARALVNRGDGEGADGWWAVLRPRLFDSQWAEVLDHFAVVLGRSGWGRLDLLVRRVLATAQNGDLAATARAVGIAGRLLRILEAYDYRPAEELGWAQARDRAMAIFTVEGAARVPEKERVAAAEALGQAGDPRFVRLEPELLAVPGPDGRPLVLLGKYPVTVHEYRRFVEHDGYVDRQYWDEPGWALRAKEGWTAPEAWDVQTLTPNRPVVSVSWYEAAAFCRWLAAVTGRPFRLPSEAEWRAAATNPAGPYPWGDVKPDDMRANFAPNNKSRVGCPSPVGIYPAGAGPFGHQDLSGNVWEWCVDDVTAEFGEGARRTGLFSEDALLALRTLRGGGFHLGAWRLPSASRRWDPASHRSDDIGFRIAAVPASAVGP